MSENHDERRTVEASGFHTVRDESVPDEPRKSKKTDEYFNSLSWQTASSSVLEDEQQEDVVLKGQYDPTRTIKLRSQPMNLEEVRYEDPQGTIEYVYQRKEKWKAAAIKYHKRAGELLAEAKSKSEEIEKKAREIKHWRKRHKQEVEMRKWWKNACLVAAGIAAVLMVTMTITTTIMLATRNNNEPQFVPRVPTSGTMQATPAHVLASVLVYNGGTQGSGTVISRGEKYAAVLTAAHNFKGNIGGEFWVYYPDGSFTKATLIAFDTKRDLALAKVDAETILGHSYVPNEMPESSEFTCVGYSNGQGPNLNNISYGSQYRNANNKYMWQVSLTDGTIWNGASGGGVFLGDACCGVTSQRDAVYYTQQGNCLYQSKRMYAVSHHEVVAFLNENKDALADCGDWTLLPERQYGAENAPPPWSPNPNVPINVPGTNLASLRADVDELRRTVFGATRRPGEIPAAPATAPAEAKPPTDSGELLPGQRRPSDVGKPPAPKE